MEDNLSGIHWEMGFDCVVALLNFYFPRKHFWQLIVLQMMGKVNQERLAEFLGELQRKEDINDRYVAALRGETLIRKPYERIQPIPKQGNTEAKEKK